MRNGSKPWTLAAIRFATTLQQMTRKKKIKRIISYSLITILIFVIVLATLILYPQPLFAKKIEYKQFSVYSNEKIDDGIKPILDSAISLVERSELYDSTYKMDLFLAYNTFFNKLDDKVFHKGPSARAIDNNMIIKVKIDVDKILLIQHCTSPVNRVLST